MYGSFSLPSSHKQRQANALAHAKDELKTLSPLLPPGREIVPQFEAQRSTKIVWHVRMGAGKFEIADTLADAVELANS